MISIKIEGNGRGMETVLKLANAYSTFDEFRLDDDVRINPREDQLNLLLKYESKLEEIEKLVNELRIFDN
ncbi:hypothetical protein [Methanococcoides sp. FTZ1]|uniref:hypothetical protein n=1 Tax=Methanococcoides sp. FTZ1 TaxID=3439061 RepID=UPI003F841EF8